jgi:hypothetical protein
MISLHPVDGKSLHVLAPTPGPSTWCGIFAEYPAGRGLKAIAEGPHQPALHGSAGLEQAAQIRTAH